MSVCHHTIEIEGEFTGHAISLDKRFVFFTPLPVLKALDGQRFETLADMREAVAEAFAATEVRPAAA